MKLGTKGQVTIPRFILRSVGLTGDRTHFGHLYGKAIGSLRVLTLTETLERLLEDN
ncbi:MAG: hypothetical protein VBE63_29275 [Lamprobacter sp.]|uniref:hypothetical protein n=1 Tax=Lamprobacter sp. TaxID=3100796 RepID=UPI002B25FCBC|nr:hypothetical protein [Lamprobacter sp.]MEA3643983.1 hypothetical protein [Lamprobacter sp.]